MTFEQKFWKISPGTKGAGWNDCRKQGTIGIGKVYKKDVHGYTEDEVKKYVYKERGKKCYQSLIKLIFKIKKGDIVVAYSSPKTIYGVGIVMEDDWVHNKNVTSKKYWLKNTRKVKWDHTFSRIPATEEIKNKLGLQEPIIEISKDFFIEKILPVLPKESEVESFLGYSKISIDIPVLNLLDQKSQIILYGPPGTGKTYKAREYAVNLIQKSILEE